MKVIYRQKFEGECEYLIDGKEYEVIDSVDRAQDGVFYLVFDEFESCEGGASSYHESMFEVVEE